MLPFYLLSKTGIHDVDTNGVSVKTRVADQAALVDTGIDELKTELLNMKPPVVGLDVKECKGKAQLFILQTGSRCWPDHSVIVLIYIRYCAINIRVSK